MQQAEQVWDHLEAQARRLRGTTLRELFDGHPDRARRLSVSAGDLWLDLSKNKVDDDVLAGLLDLARVSGVPERIRAMFAGERINTSEDRPVLHVALRRPADEPLMVDGTDVVADVHRVRDQMAAFARQVRSGQWLGATGQRIRTVVNIGIGGSDLGPRMVVRALRRWADGPVQARFVANVDGSDLSAALTGLDPASTLFIVCSKTFTTAETLANARAARGWLTDALGEDAVERHFVAVSTNLDAVREFGIDPDNAFGFWDWVGGRYSLTSAVGLSIVLALGPEVFDELLAGFHDLDEHVRTTPLERNLPALLGLVGVWNRDLLGLDTLAVLPYAQDLELLPAYLQQLDMESNGKRVTRDGAPVRHGTGPVVWGQPGTNGQHAFYQLLHQGTVVVPCEMIAFREPLSPLVEQHTTLLANCLAQTQALAFGRTSEQVAATGMPAELVAHRTFPGDRPSTTLLVRRLSPRTLGQLVAAYEHKILVQGVVWGINSFDQWGVELGKSLAKQLAGPLSGAPPEEPLDPSTDELVRLLREGW